jgi:hypothetical protein
MNTSVAEADAREGRSEPIWLSTNQVANAEQLLRTTFAYEPRRHLGF